MEQIRAHFAQFAALSDAEWSMFAARLEVQSFAKRTLLLRPGKVERYLSFIERGIVHQYVPGEARSRTFAFAFGGQFVSAYDSFLRQAPATYAVGTLAPTVLWRISYEDLQDIYARSAAGNLIGRRAGEELFIRKSARELSLLTETAGQRYRRLLDDQPALIREIPLQHIASYIGVTPQALSRIRKRLSGG